MTGYIESVTLQRSAICSNERFWLYSEAIILSARLIPLVQRCLFNGEYSCACIFNQKNLHFRSIMKSAVCHIGVIVEGFIVAYNGSLYKVCSQYER